MVMIYIIRRRFVSVFGYPTVDPGEVSDTLGAGGLALHYAHLLVAINKMVNRPTLVLRSARWEGMEGGRMGGGMGHGIGVGWGMGRGGGGGHWW